MGILRGDMESRKHWYQSWRTRTSILILHLSEPQLPHLPARSMTLHSSKHRSIWG